MRSFLRTCLIAFAAIFLATGAAVATFVQGATATNGGTAGTSLTVTLSAVGTGNCVWGIVSADNNGAVITATIGGTSFNIVDTATDAGNGEVSRTFILGNISLGPTSVVVSFSVNARGSAIFIEESGCLAASNPVDVHNFAVTAATTNPSSPSVVTTVANDIVVGALLNDGGSTAPTAGTSPLAFTLRNTTTFATSLPMATEDGVTSGASGSSVAANWVDTQSQVYSAFVIAIKPAAATGSKPSFLPLVGVGGN